MRWLALLLLVLVGCEEDLLPADAGLPACRAGHVRWSMEVRALSVTGQPLAGVRACVVDQPEICEETGADGVFAPCVPMESDVAFTFEMGGYTSLLYAIHTSTVEPSNLRLNTIVMLAEGPVGEFWRMFGIAYPTTTQALAWLNMRQNDPEAAYLPPGLGAVSAIYAPPAAQGPFYTDSNDTYDPNATATVANSPGIYAAFSASGEQTVTLAHPTLSTCAALEGGWSAGPNMVRVPVRVGFRTYMNTTCY